MARLSGSHLYVATPGTGITQPLLIMDTPQGRCCIQLSHRKNALLVEDLMIVITAKKSMYSHLLCNVCIQKPQKKKVLHM